MKTIVIKNKTRKNILGFRLPAYWDLEFELAFGYRHLSPPVTVVL
jgi:hypothetical protein